MKHSQTSRSRVRRALVGAATALMVAASLATASSAQATFPGKVGLVLFTRGGDLYTANSSGGAITRLTTVGQIAGPKWSPNGKSIVYRRGTTIYTRSYPGGVTKTIATGAKSDPAWAPDGTKVAYLATIPTSACGDRAIYTSPIAGGVPTKAWDPHEDMCPGYVFTYTVGTYVPDGRLLLTGCFTRGEDSNCYISAITMDGTDSGTTLVGLGCWLEDQSTPCTQGEHLSDARTGPAGTSIYFSGRGGYDAPTGTLPGSTPTPTAGTLERPYTINSTGTNLHSVTTATSGYSVTRAPTGSAILLTQKSGSTTNILKASADVATARATTFITNGSQPDWQPVP